MAATPSQHTESALNGLKFETAIDELEHIVRSMEGNASSSLELEASIAAYQRGMALLKHCQNQLAEAEQRIQVLTAANTTEAST